MQSAYISQGFGVMISWDMFTERPLVGVPTIEDYAPTDMDVDQWLDAAASAEAKYAIMTANGNYGFAMWPTAFHVGENQPFSVAQTAYYAANGSPDPLALFVAGCATRNIRPCFYYRLPNEKFEGETGYTMLANPVEYTALFVAQLTELLTNYGNIDAIWVDGWDTFPGGTQISFDAINTIVKSLQPNCLLIMNRTNHTTVLTRTEIETHENDGITSLGDTCTPKEYLTPIYSNGDWYYDPAHDQTAAGLLTEAGLKQQIEFVNNRGAVFCLNITPGYDGHIPAAQVTLLGLLP